jgi:lipopolysaccharide/colanic/teichoic acid biosynthesis glycosyltransferase
VIYRLIGKRALDLILGTTFLVIALPILAVTSILVLTGMGRPIFFRQDRIGKDGKKFNIVKFRTMQQPSKEANGSHPDQDRIGRLGSFLRSSSLDELPSLLNVISGSMSLIGPRPLLEVYLTSYSKEQLKRHEVKPGLTGLVQVSGRNEIDWQEKFKLDLEYINNYSLCLDIKILLKTIPAVFSRKGITYPGSPSMPAFKNLSGEND